MTMNAMKALALRASERAVKCVKYNADGDLVFTAGDDGLVSVWSTRNGQRLGTYHFRDDNSKASDGQRNRTIDEEWLQAHHVESSVRWLDVKIDSSLLAVASFSNIVFYDVSTGKFVDCIAEVAQVLKLEFNRNPLKQNRLVCSHNGRGGRSEEFPAIHVFESDDGSRKWRRTLEIGDFEGIATTVAWGPMDDRIIAGSDCGKIYQWDLEGKEICSVTAHRDTVTAIDFNKDRTLMLTVSKDMTAALWEVVPKFTLMKRFQLDRPLVACAISPLFDAEGSKKKPHMILAGGQEAEEVTTTTQDAGFFETLLINMIFENEIGRSLGHFSPITSLAFSPDGTSFATGAFEGNVRVHKFSDTFMEHDHHQA